MLLEKTDDVAEVCLKRVALKYQIFLLGFGVAVIADQISKHLVINRFELGESLPIISDFFNFTSIRNPGAAFGFLSQVDSSFRTPFFILVPIVALGIIFFIFHRLQDNDIKQSTSLSLIAGGALGNLIDRIQLGHVVDFLDFHIRSQGHYPAFNLADVAICSGVGLLLIISFQSERQEKRRKLSQRELIGWRFSHWRRKETSVDNKS